MHAHEVIGAVGRQCADPVCALQVDRLWIATPWCVPQRHLLFVLGECGAELRVDAELLPGEQLALAILGGELDG